MVEDIKPEILEYPIINEYLALVISCVKNPISEIAKQRGLSKPDIEDLIARNAEYIKKRVSEILKESDIDKLQVMEELKNIAYSSISDFGQFDGEEMSWEDWKKLDRKALACVKDIKVTWDKYGNKNVHFTLYDKQTALRDLIKVLELSHDVVEHTGTVNVTSRLFDK